MRTTRAERVKVHRALASIADAMAAGKSHYAVNPRVVLVIFDDLETALELMQRLVNELETMSSPDRLTKALITEAKEALEQK